MNLPSFSAQSPDLENDFGIGRAVLTPEDALKQYTDMNRGQINRLLRGDFDIMNFKLSESNSGFFLTQTKVSFLTKDSSFSSSLN